MSQYQTLKTQIQENIKQNGKGAIRGDILQTQLLDMINALGAGYQFIGVATPTNPGTAQTPDYKCFYIATTPGTYTNLGGLVVADGEVALLKYDTSWTKEVTGAATAAQVSQLGQEKVDKEVGKVLSDNNFTDVLKNKLEGIAENATKNDSVLDNYNKDTFYIADYRGNVVAKVDEKGLNTIGIRIPNTRTVNDGLGGFTIADSFGNVALKLDKKHTLHDNLGELVKLLYCTPQVSWIDDDFSIFNQGTTVISDLYSFVHQWCLDNNVRFDFAYIPTSYMDTPDTREKITIAKEWEEEGFRFLIHPIHEGWYTHGTPGQPGYFEHDINAVQEGIVKCIKYFQVNNFVSNPRILVYPGATPAYPDNVNLLTKYIECGISATLGSTNHGVVFDRYHIQRYAMEFSHPGRPKSVVKQEIMEYLNRGDWVILYTHLYGYDLNGPLDETSDSIANVLDLVNFINSQYEIRPTEEIWSKRKFLYDYFKR